MTDITPATDEEILKWGEMAVLWPRTIRGGQIIPKLIARIRQGEAEKERLVSALTEIDSYNRIHNDLEAYLSELADWGLSRRETRPTAAEFGFKTS